MYRQERPLVNFPGDRNARTADVVQYSSISGEVAPNLQGRTDFQKYDSGWQRAQNWTVDYRGGLFTRHGYEFGDLIEWSEGEAVKFVDFQFSPDTANTYVLIFTDDKLRFVQDNAYVLESDIAVASLANDSGDRVEFTATSHGFSNGDWVKLSDFSTNSSFNTRTMEVANVATNTFTLIDPITGSALEVASVTTETGTVNRIYTITSPYGQEDLKILKAKQIRDTLRLTHPDYPAKNLTRASATSWSIANETIGSNVAQPASVSLVSSTNTGYSFLYGVTAVDENGNEGAPRVKAIINVENFDNVVDRITISWAAVTGAVSYNIYRSRTVSSGTGNQLFSDSQLGYIGNAIGTRFTDPGITPDFTRSPIIEYNPFANGAIQYVTVSTTGSNYTYESTITWPAGGSGASGLVVGECDAATAIYGIRIFNGGKDYTGTTITVADGSGATLTAELSAATGNNPHCSGIFQQRQMYAATDENPLRIYGSRPGQLSNFNYTDIGADDDSYEFDLDSPQIAPIRHLVSVQGGLLVFNQIGVWLIYGPNEATVTGNNAIADPQAAVGASHVPPVFLDSYVVYAAQAGQEVRLLRYTDQANGFVGQNVSILANHLFSPNDPIVALTYASVPAKAVYAAQESGRMVATTIDIENNVYAATPHYTKGYYRYCLSILEGSEDRLYTAVEREINGNRVMFFERSISQNDRNTLDDAFCVDAGLELTKTAPAGRLVPSSVTGAVTFTTVGGTPFVVGDIGKIIRCGCGKATITGYTSSSVVTGTWTRDLVETYPETSDPAEFLSGDWWMDSTASTLTGLWHLEGETVSALADGAVITGLTVSNGAVSLGVSASRVVIGLPYTCIAQTLPITATDVAVEGRRKRIIGTAVRELKSSGLKAGPSLTKLKYIHDRLQALYGLADRLRTDMVFQPVESDWSMDNSVYFVQDSPRPAAILNFVRDVDIGDDKN